MKTRPQSARRDREGAQRKGPFAFPFAIFGFSELCLKGIREVAVMDSRVILEVDHSLAFVGVEYFFKFRKHWLEIGVSGLGCV